MCKADRGGQVVGKDNWTTFLKATLECSVNPVVSDRGADDARWVMFQLGARPTVVLRPKTMPQVEMQAR